MMAKIIKSTSNFRLSPLKSVVSLFMFAQTLVGGQAGIVAAEGINQNAMEVAANNTEGRSESGITGQVSIRPVRPHATYGTSNIMPYQAKIEVFDSSGRMLTAIETDPNGTFRIPLPPGKYVLRPQSPGPYPRASEQTVVVSPRNFSQVRVVYDSGIR
jgi:hypothetical protein